MKKKFLGAAALLLAALALFAFAGCSKYRTGDRSTVMTVGGKKIARELYDYVFIKSVEVRFGIGTRPEDLNDEQKRLAHEDSEAELRKFCAVESLAAREGVALDEAEMLKIEGEIAAAKAGYADKNAYYQAFKDQDMTENVFYLETVNYYLEAKLFEHCKDMIGAELDDETLKKDYQEHFFTCMQIFLTGENALETLKKVKRQIDEGASFTEMAERYSRDGEKIRCFAEGEMQEFLENAVKGLAPGQVSEAFASELGAHVVMRLENRDDYFESHKEDLRYTDTVRLYNAMLQKEADALTVEIVKLPYGL